MSMARIPLQDLLHQHHQQMLQADLKTLYPRVTLFRRKMRK